jgi:hypothetical protein
VQGNLRNAFVATRIFYNGSLAYSAAPADLLAIEPSLSWTNGPLDASSPDRTIFVGVFDNTAPGDRQVVIVAGRTKQGRCFYLKDVMGGSDGGTYFDRKVSGGAACPVPDPADPDWADHWSLN